MSKLNALLTFPTFSLIFPIASTVLPAAEAPFTIPCMPDTPPAAIYPAAPSPASNNTPVIAFPCPFLAGAGVEA